MHSLRLRNSLKRVVESIPFSNQGIPLNASPNVTSCYKKRNQPLHLVHLDARAVLSMALRLLLHKLFIMFVCIASSRVVTYPEKVTNDSSSLDLSVPEGDITTSRRTSSPNLSWPATYAPAAPVKINISLSPAETTYDVNNIHLAAPRIQCDASTYGRDLNIASCQEAWELLPTTTTPRTIGQRTEGNFDIPLPFRVLSHDGLCAIDITHKKGLIFDISTGSELSQAALLILDACVKGDMQQGGVAIGIGEQERWKV